MFVCTHCTRAIVLPSLSLTHTHTHTPSHPHSMQGEKAEAPKFFPSTFAFHHCRVFLSHLGMLSWDKRCRILKLLVGMSYVKL